MRVEQPQRQQPISKEQSAAVTLPPGCFSAAAPPQFPQHDARPGRQRQRQGIRPHFERGIGEALRHGEGSRRQRARRRAAQTPSQRQQPGCGQQRAPVGHRAHGEFARPAHARPQLEQSEVQRHLVVNPRAPLPQGCPGLRREVGVDRLVVPQAALRPLGRQPRRNGQQDQPCRPQPPPPTSRQCAHRITGSGLGSAGSRPPPDRLRC